MKRTTNIFIRVSEEEKQAWTALAAKDGMTVSAWLRRLAYLEVAKGEVVKIQEG